MTSKDFELKMSVIAQLDEASLKNTIKQAQAEIDAQTKKYNEAKKKFDTLTKKSLTSKKPLGNEISRAQIDMKDASSALDKAGQQLLNSQKVLSQRLIAERKDMYTQLRKINQQESSMGISDADMKALEKQRKQIQGQLSGNTRDINRYGNTEAIETSKQLSQQYQTLKLTDSVQQNINKNAQNIKEAYRLANEYSKEMAQNEQRIAQLEKTQSPKNDNSAEITQLKQNNEEIQKLRNEKMKVVAQDEQLLQSATEIEQRYRRQTDAIKSQNNSLKDTTSLTEKLKKNVENIARYVLMYKALNAIEQATRSAIQTVIDLDTAFTDIQLVTGETDEQIQQLAEDYNELAQQMGSTTQEVAEGASEWLRQGKSVEETSQLLKSSMTLSKVGAIESSEATSLLTSTLNGYKMTAEESMQVVDKISAIDMAAATSSEELMTALSRTANSAADANVSFDKLLAMIATVSSVTRKSASTIGESFKTIFSRMSNVAAGKDIDDAGESLNDVETSLNKMGIALRDSQYEWRSFEEVLDEVASKWDSFNNTQQSQIATAIAGTRQQENFRALMNNWDQVSQMVGVAESSTGTASERMNIYLDSLEAKINQLKSTWEGFIMSLQQSDSLKWGIDILIDLLNNIDALIPALITLGTVLSSGKIASGVMTLFTNFGKLSATIQSFGGITGLLKNKLTDLKAGFALLEMQMNGAKLTAEGTALAMSSLQAVISGVTLVIGLGITAYQSWKQAQVEAAEAAREEADAQAEKISTLESVRQKYQEVYNSNLTYSEKQEEIKSLSDQLKTAYEDEAYSLDLLTGSYENNIAAMEKKENAARKLQKAQLNSAADAGAANLDNWINFGNTGDISSGGQGIASEDESSVMTFLDQLGGDKIRYNTDAAAYGGFLKKSQVEGMDEDVNITSIMGSYTITNEEAHKYAQAIEEYLNENVETLQEETVNALTNFASSLKSNADEDAEQQFQDLQSAQLMNFMTNEDGSYKQQIQNYKDSLEEEASLQEKYDAETNQVKKENYAQQLGEQKQLTAQYLADVLAMYDENNKEQSTLSINTIKNALGASEATAGSLYSELNEEQGNKLLNLVDQLSKSSEITDETKQKILDLRKEIAALGNETALEEFDNKMKELGVSINDNADDWQKLRNAITAPTTQYTQGADGQITGTQLSDYDKYLQIKDELQKLLEANDIKFSDSWYNSLEEQLQKGEISAGQFFDYLEQGAQAFGVDLGNAISQATASTEEMNPFLGTQEDFVDQADNIDQMYSDASTLADGGTLDNQRIVDLRNEYAELNDYIAETGDLTFKNGQMLVDIANQTYDEGTDAIDTQIEALEDYQDAILNTVDALGIMAEFQEELAKIDEETANQITDDAIEQAKAKGEFVDVADSAADGIYDANETIQDSDMKTYSLLEANAKGLIDTNDEKAMAAVKAAEDSVRALYDEANVSGEVYTLTADYIEQNRQALLDKGWTEEQITAAKTQLAGIQINADGSIALAAQDQAATTEDAQLATAKAFVSVSQAAVSTAQAIAGLFGVESAALTQAQADLAEAQATISEVESGAGDQEKAAQLAKMYAESQNKIKEGQARINTIGANRKAGNAGYNKARAGSGGSGKSDAEKAAEEAEKLQEDIQKFREDESIEMEDVTEELIKHYELEKSRLELEQERLEYANDLLDSEENTTQWLKVQNQLLTNQRKQIQEIYRANSKIDQQFEKIQSENPQYDISSWFDENGEATLAYKNLLNSFAQQERDYRATVSLNSEEDIENAEKYIEKLEEQRDYVENLFDSASQLKEAWIDNRDALQDLFTEMNDTLKEMRDTLLDKFMGALEDRVDEVNQAYEDNIDKLDSLITVQERYNDVINSSLQTQADLRKELQSNKDSYQYLDDYMRSIIFNEDDYKELSKELDKVMSDMNALSDEYQYKINNLTEDEMYMLDEITNEYERQVDLKEKEYEILQAQLDVVKARTQLENARNERTVRMFANGEWQWVADPEEIKSANEELADAQAAVEQAIREKEQEELLHQMEAEQDKNQIAIDKNEQLLEQIQDRVDEITTETKSIEEWLELIATEGPPMLHDIFADIGTKLEELMDDLGNDSSKVDAAGQNTTEAIKQGLLNGTLDPDQWAEKIGWIKGDNGKWYAPMDDPYYDPAGFDFGKANVDTSSTTDKSGVQIQGQGEVAANNQNQQTNTGFPRQGSLRNVSSVLNIRSGAGMDYGIIGKIPPSGKPQILGENGNWAQVNYNGITGWASKDYLTYDKGGLLKGKGVALKDTLKPEAILSPEQTKAWTKLVDNLTNPMLAQLTATPSVQKDNTNNTEKYIGDNYVFNNVTVKADDIDQFITSIKGWVPIS